MVNVGGGFFGHMHPDMPFKNTPTFNDYAQVVTDILNANDWVQKNKPTLVIEPGVAMVADAVSFVMKVVSVKMIRDETFVTVDGSAFHAKPTFHSLNLPHEIISQTEAGSAGNIQCCRLDLHGKGLSAQRHSGPAAAGRRLYQNRLRGGVHRRDESAVHYPRPGDPGQRSRRRQTHS